MIEASAPGKLFIAGEHAVVDAGEPAVLVAVDRCIRVRLEERADAPSVEASEHVRAAIRAVEELRRSRGLPARCYELSIESELEDPQGRKFGLGSSGAVTVAVVAALNELHGLGLGPSERFRLALLATIEISPRASGGDLAASTFGGWIRYTAPDRERLRMHREQHGVAATLVHPAAWEQCGIRSLAAPDELRLLVGWTGAPASTEQIVAGVQAARGGAEGDHAEFLAESRRCVGDLVAALERGGADAPAVIRRARRVLQRLAETAGLELETEKLGSLCDIAERHGAAGKPSGAGRGDCGIVLAGPGSDVDAILHEWEANGILDLGLRVHPVEGVVDER